MKRIIYLLVAAIGLLVGCTPDEETWVQAGFTTDCSLQMGIYG